jgi:hypothetical protein
MNNGNNICFLEISFGPCYSWYYNDTYPAAEITKLRDRLKYDVSIEL